MWWIQPRLHFACNQCGECCRAMDVPLSHYDLLQLARAHPDRSPSDYVYRHRSHPMHPEALLLEGDYFILYLQRRTADDACIFLGAEGQCLNYSARPRACRTFPFDQHPNGLLRIMPDIDFLYLDHCDKDPLSKQTLKQIRQEIKTSAQEFSHYHEIVERWNRRVARKPERQTLPHFLEFLFTLDEMNTSE